MFKVPFNSEGVSAKKRELATLLPEDFNRQLYLLVHDTSGWVRENFILTREQENKLAKMPATFLQEIMQVTEQYCYN